jgi:predicted nuclease of predicted toxin-antitoxin system
MAAIRFHLDQHVAGAVAHGLRQYGVDVTTTLQAGLQDADDADHLAFALAEGRVFVTHDSDFIERHNKGEQHAGICYCPQTKYQRRASALLQAVYLVYACLSAKEMHDHVEYL